MLYYSSSSTLLSLPCFLQKFECFWASAANLVRCFPHRIRRVRVCRPTQQVLAVVTVAFHKTTQ